LRCPSPKATLHRREIGYTVCLIILFLVYLFIPMRENVSLLCQLRYSKQMPQTLCQRVVIAGVAGYPHFWVINRLWKESRRSNIDVNDFTAKMR
jgi:hypothetical protein